MRVLTLKIQKTEREIEWGGEEERERERERKKEKEKEERERERDRERERERDEQTISKSARKWGEEEKEHFLFLPSTVQVKEEHPILWAHAILL